MPITPLQFRSARFSRWLGLLLIAFIFYGTTIEAAHRHGRVLSETSDVASLTQSDGSGNLSGTQTGCSDCLICQLHQNFNTTLIAFRIADPPKQIRVNLTADLPLDVLSQITGPTAGRAPPAIS